MTAKNNDHRRYIRSEQTRMRISEALRGRKLSKRHRAAISVAMKKLVPRG